MKMTKPTILIACLGWSLLLATGCTMEPKYEKPVAPVDATWPEGSAYKLQNENQQPATDISQLGWQSFFADEHLRGVIELALENNRDMRIAALNVERARILYGIQHSDLLPRINAGAGAGKQSLPADLSGIGDRNEASTYQVNLGIAEWELDFFGRIRSLEKVALHQFLASSEARRSVQILLVSSVADAYMSLAADRENLGLAKTTLQAQQDTLDLVKHRYDRGLAPELDVHRAQTQVDTARVSMIQYTQRVAQTQNVLNLLVGMTVPSELLPDALDEVALMQDIPVGLPSDVLLHRPDIIQAEHQLIASYANIGAARAAFFPRISLTAALGTASADLSDLFQAGQGTWNFDVQATLPVFDPRTWKTAKISEVEQQIALAKYEQTIQTSFRDVANVLAVRGTVDDQVNAQQSLVESVSQTHKLSQARYLKGVDNYLSVLDAQRSLYTAQQQLVTLRLAKLINQAQLYAALGGGWRDANPLASDTDTKPHTQSQP